jgi:hypothetical protein
LEQLKAKPTVSAADLTEAALLYVDIYTEPGRTPHQKMLVREPMTPAYDRLRFTYLIEVAVLPPVLDMMDVLLGELRAARPAELLVGKLKAELDARAEEIIQMQAANDRLQAEHERLRQEIAAMQASTSWRLTAPLRAGARRLSALRPLGRQR